MCTPAPNRYPARQVSRRSEADSVAGGVRDHGSRRRGSAPPHTVYAVDCCFGLRQIGGDGPFLDNPLYPHPWLTAWCEFTAPFSDSPPNLDQVVVIWYGAVVLPMVLVPSLPPGLQHDFMSRHVHHTRPE